MFFFRVFKATLGKVFTFPALTIFKFFFFFTLQLQLQQWSVYNKQRKGNAVSQVSEKAK